VNNLEEKITGFINRCVDYLSVFLFIVIFIMVLVQICLRYIFNSPLIWSEELVRYAFVWICYLGWALGSRNRTHIQITVFLNLLPEIARKILDTVNSLILIVLSIYMIVFGMAMTIRSASLPAITIPITLGLVYLAVPVSNTAVILYEILYLKNTVWRQNKAV
jgi:TRAP-type transport system small permease protein